MEPERVREMMFQATTLMASLMAAIIVVRWGWNMMKWLWLNPKRMERMLRDQGLQANPYRFWIGDLWEMVKMQEQVKSLPIPSHHSHDLAPRVLSFVHHIANKYGKNSFIWFGPTPRVILRNPEQVKEMLNRNYDFTKRQVNPLIKYLGSGLGTYDGDKWTKHRKIINPAFNFDRLKNMMPAFTQSCIDMIREWEKMMSPLDGTCELDVWPWLKNLTENVISRAAFGSSYEEGKQIFDLLAEQAELVMSNFQRYHIPLWRFIHAKDKRRMEEIDKMVDDLLKGIIMKKKEEAVMKKVGGDEVIIKNDLLSILLESNHHKEVDESLGMSLQEVIKECKAFYVGGQETTSVLLVWTMMLLGKYPDWQTRAREEVFQVFGNQKPDYGGLNRLKIVTMILYEVLRLYPPAVWMERSAEKDMKLGNLLVPKGVQLVIPTLMIHHDQEIWGSDAKEFKPERFSEGISKAGKGNCVAYFPFGRGPRICIGQNFSLLQAKTALSLILQCFWFELSPSYSHSPSVLLTLQPDHGVHLILHKLKQ
ncbi:11-oxo-beta-amyrin 30-oxidase-like [Neltuma alba]|uniref:11-oxo-beta-amyrin 30-oxidase-like n=1 Tax=Neltuma alba TaxID=207710 RepID=UPI0010A52E7B|nr:11-oxo-beta-amyrin 30-oxidase-like [Prosopis alba]XP_028796135.1 11-oxo-beta-amyrin 30-oxidase-like [Prosopis alba]